MHRASLVAHMVKNLPAVQDTWLWSLGLEDPLEKGVTTLSSILAWRILWTEEPGGLQSMGSQRDGQNWVTNTFTFFFHVRKGACSLKAGHASFMIFLWPLQIKEDLIQGLSPLFRLSKCNRINFKLLIHHHWEISSHLNYVLHLP